MDKKSKRNYFKETVIRINFENYVLKEVFNKVRVIGNNFNIYRRENIFNEIIILRKNSTLDI